MNERATLAPITLVENTSTNALELQSSEKKQITKHREERYQLPVELETKVTITLSNQTTLIGSVQNVSMFGARVSLQKDECFLATNMSVPVKLEISNQAVFQGMARVVAESLRGSRVEFGLAFTDSTVDLNQVKAVLGEVEFRPRLASTNSAYAIAAKIKSEFKEHVADLNTLYQDLRSRLLVEEARINETAVSPKHKARLEEHAVTLAISIYVPLFNEIFGRFQRLVETFSPDEHTLHKRYFRANFSNLVSNTPFMNRAFQKPLGYAGDFGLMIMFYEYEDLGGNLFDKFFHRLACNQPASVANKNRVELLSELIREHFSGHNPAETFKISNIACGPARELQLFVNDTEFTRNQKIKFVIADQEALALDHATQKLRAGGQAQGCDVEVTALREDIVLGSIKKRPFCSEFEGSNLVISAGLFDYLSDRVATKLIGALYEFVKPGGELIIGNVSDQNPDKFTMDYLMEWNLILRSSTQLMDLVPTEIRSSSARCEVTSESLGLNLFLRIHKPKS